MSLSVWPPTGAFPNSTVLETFYRPLNVSELIPGDIHPDWTSDPYGSYNYCSMPHPNAAYYSPVEGGELVYLEYIQRHQRRTPYNTLPGDVFWCDDIAVITGEQLTGTPGTSNTIQVVTPDNDWATVNGSCQYPQLTGGGYQDAVIHGSDLWLVYGELLNFLPRQPGPKDVRVRASNSPLTVGSATGVLPGLYPVYGSSFPIHQQPAGMDSVNSGFTCPRRTVLQNAQRAAPEWQAHLNEMQPVVDALNATGFTKGFAASSAWTQTFDHLNDNFQAKLCNGVPLTVNTTLRDAVFNAGDWEWDYYWRSGPNVTDYIKATEGPFIAEIIERLQNPGTLKMHYTFAHDGDIGPIAGALGIEQLRWPGMGSNIAFEVWNVTGELKVRVLYSGSPIRSTSGLSLDTGASVSDFVKYFETYSLTDETWCNASS